MGRGARGGWGPPRGPVSPGGARSLAGNLREYAVGVGRDPSEGQAIREAHVGERGPAVVDAVNNNLIPTTERVVGIYGGKYVHCPVWLKARRCPDPLLRAYPAN